jgi:signal transduction histidine kinase
MTALRGGIELGLMGKRSAAEYRSLLEQSLQLADGVVQLIVSLRDLGESSAPGGPPRHVVLGDLAAEALAELEVLAQSRDIHLQLRTEGEPKACANHERVREALHSLLAWIIQNSAGGDDVTVRVATSEREARLVVATSRSDLQYIQIKVLEDTTTPGSLFAYATKNGVLGWAINQRMWEGVGGRLEILTEGQDAGSVRVSLPLAPAL